MKDWSYGFRDGFSTAISVVFIGLVLAYWTGYLKIYGIGMFGVGRLFCFQGP